ncbi:hypothetical protein A1OS_06070 [Enterovibrio norvegicus]|uniref:DUF2061 domain-containing protein n=1 Tax=Enterovibrio norvegicus TaxID=188144 RepID=UPI0002FDB1A6|nr:DUF2061 domain-containing protein [Enterovibrio norvegicus]OEE51419.1 hypothetical protein A1OS_06070 [Enterovibrio norvegicus]
MKKTLSFAVIHFTVAFTVAFVLTGDILLGSLIAMVEPMVNTVAFYFHEKAWESKMLKNALRGNPGRKTASFAAVHFSVAFTVVYLLTGDILVGSLMAMIEPCINTMAYYFHEKVWQKRATLNAWYCHHDSIIA